MKLRELIEEKKGLIIDIEGVLVSNVEKGSAYQDALGFYSVFKTKPKVFLTNLARLSTIYTADALNRYGFIGVKHEHIVNPTKAAIGQILSKRFVKPVNVLVVSEGGHYGDILSFPWINITKNEPIDAILFGANRLITYRELNEVYKLFKKGVPLIVLGGEYVSEGEFFGEEGEFLVEGAFAKMLEIVANKEAIYVGKPAKEMFLEALNRLNLDINEVLMIGDTFHRDILGAVRLGMDALFLNRKNTPLEDYKSLMIREDVKGEIYVSENLELDKEINKFI
ncbi:MAG: HAD-IA family hydrolase [Candidatus Njordarchaeia archaeon]